MAWLDDWLDIPGNIEKVRQAGVSIAEAATTSALGKLEMDLPTKILGPVKTAMHDIVADALAQADKWVDKQLKKVRIGEQG
jgi:hypothetical protein